MSSLGRVRTRRSVGAPLVAALLALLCLVVGVSAASGGSSGAATTRVSIAPRTIGFLNVAGASATAQLMQNDASNGTRFLGWNLITCDAQGNPGKMAACMSSLVEKSPDAIITMSMEPTLIRDGLNAATAKRIPVVNIGGALSDSTPFAASFAPDDKKMAQSVFKRITKDFAQKSKVKIGLWLNDAVFAQKVRGDEFRRLLAASPKFEVVASVQASYTNPFQQSTQDAQAMLQAHQDLDAIWVNGGSLYLPGIANALGTEGRMGKVSVYGYFTEPILQKLVTDGAVVSQLDVTIGQSAYAALDFLLQRFQKKTIAKPIGFSYRSLEKSNIKDANKRRKYPLFYQQRWEKAFG